MNDKYKKVEINLEEERKMLLNEIERIDSLYDETKNHFDQVKVSRQGNTLSFIHLQTGNLVNLKNSKLNLINALINLEKTKADIKLKELNLNKNNDESNSDYNNIANELFKVIMENKKDVTFKSTNMISKNLDDEETIDNKLEERLKEEVINNEETINQKQKKLENINEINYVCDEDGQVYIIDNEDNILEDGIIPDDIQVKFKGKGNSLKAFLTSESLDIYDEEIEIISFEE